MNRILKRPVVVGLPSSTMAVVEGGTGVQVAAEIAGSIGAIPAVDIDVNDGVAGLDANGKLKGKSVSINSTAVRIVGDREVITNSVTTYQITNYDAFTIYNVSASAGTITRSGGVLTYTAPATEVTANITINGTVFTVIVAPSRPVKPTFTYPVNNAVGVGPEITLIISAFGVTSGSDTHASTDWQVATDTGFTNIISQVTASAADKLSYKATNLAVNAKHYVRARFKGVALGYGEWSTILVFTTKNVFYPSSEKQKIIGNDTIAGDNFGNAVSLSLDGGHLAIGAMGRDDAGVDSGSVYIFNNTGTSLTQQSKIVAITEPTSMTLNVASEGSIRVQIAGLFPSDNTYTNSQSISIPTGVTAMTLVGKGGVGTSTYNAGQPYIAAVPAQTVLSVTVANEGVFFTGNNPTPASFTWSQDSETSIPISFSWESDTGNSFDMYRYNRSTFTGTSRALNPEFGFGWRVVVSGTMTVSTRMKLEDAWSPGVDNEVGGRYVSATVISQITGTPGQTYIAPYYTYTTGPSSSAVINGTAYTFSGGYGAAASESTQSVSFAVLGSGGSAFGNSVSIDNAGTRLAIGSPFSDPNNITDAGSVFIFVRSGTTWEFEAKLIAAGGAADDRFGWSVSISGDGSYVAIGAWRDDDKGADSGSAYIFNRTGTTWTQQAKLVAADGAASDQFGWSVSINSDGSYVVAGAYGADDKSGNSGAAYIFARSATSWVQQAKLVAADGVDGDQFGSSVSISGDGSYVVIGAYVDDTSISLDSGSAYVFVRSGATWAQQAKLVATDGAGSDYFGCSVSISATGDEVLIGACKTVYAAGEAYLFTRSDVTWSQRNKFSASDKKAGDNFGGAVCLSSNGGVGAIGGVTSLNAVYVFA